MRVAAIDALAWISLEGMNQRLAELDEDTFRAAARSLPPEWVRGANRPRALAVFRKLYDETSDPLKRISLLMKASELGGADIAGRLREELGKCDPAQAKQLVDFRLKPILDTIRGNDPEWVSRWLYAYCYFNQAAGGITCYGDDGSSMSDPQAYSGYGSAANNPAWVSWSGIGPLPAGDYWIGPPYDGNLGKPQFRLTPVKDPFMHIPDMSYRDPHSFLIHANSQDHPGMASEGCIVTSRALRHWLAEEGGGVTTVYNPLNNPLNRRIALTTP